MVFDGFLHNLYLFGRKPTLQTRVSGEYPSAGDMMDGTRPGHADVMISGNGIDHIDVGAGCAHEIKRTAYDPRDMAEVVRFVELGILRKNVCLYKLNQIEACCIAYHH